VYAAASWKPGCCMVSVNAGENPVIRSDFLFRLSEKMLSLYSSDIVIDGVNVSGPCGAGGFSKLKLGPVGKNRGVIVTGVGNEGSAPGIGDSGVSPAPGVRIAGGGAPVGGGAPGVGGAPVGGPPPGAGPGVPSVPPGACAHAGHAPTHAASRTTPRIALRARITR
jgi:hypothetical protein